MGRKRSVTIMPPLSRIIGEFPTYVKDVEHQICLLMELTKGEFRMEYTEPLELCVRDLVNGFYKQVELGDDLELDHDEVYRELTDRVDYELYASSYEAGVAPETDDYSEITVNMVDLMFSIYVDFFLYLTRSPAFWDKIDFGNCTEVIIHDCDDYSGIEFNMVS